MFSGVSFSDVMRPASESGLAKTQEQAKKSVETEFCNSGVTNHRPHQSAYGGEILTIPDKQVINQKTIAHYFSLPQRKFWLRVLNMTL